MERGSFGNVIKGLKTDSVLGFRGPLIA